MAFPAVAGRLSVSRDRLALLLFGRPLAGWSRVDVCPSRPLVSRCRGGRAAARRARHLRRTSTRRSRWTFVPSSCWIARRAAVPTALIILPPAPMRIPFCESVSVHACARTMTSSSRSSISSTTTSTACGTSWNVRRRTCSRMSSASSTSSGWSERRRRRDRRTGPRAAAPAGGRRSALDADAGARARSGRRRRRRRARRPRRAPRSSAGGLSRSTLLTAITTRDRGAARARRR